ncbi:hypothetical protein BKA57DRAFT_228870 [Linnemannia elongata]|nr:hypothetical protein BKA57DRAFT_228870 [Linnemannia elongata]
MKGHTPWKYLVPFPRRTLSCSATLSLLPFSVALCFPFSSLFLCRILLSFTPPLIVHQFFYFLTPFLRVRLRVFVHVCCLIRGGVKMTRVYVRVCICVDSKAGWLC